MFNSYKLLEATETLNNTAVWEYYESIVETACHGGAEVIDKDKLDAATYLLAHAVMTNSFQRSGAVISLEFETGQERNINRPGGDSY